jgi:hypothetical protein
MLRRFALGVAAQQVKARARRVVALEVELAKAELREKAARYGAAIGLGIGAAVLALFAFGFLLAGAAAALALVIPIWAALLAVFGILILLSALLGLGAVKSIKSAGPPVPQQAIEEARLTTAQLRSNGSA